MILNQYEDPTRRMPPPEPSTDDYWPEPEDHCDYIDTLTDETTDTP